MTKAKVTAKWLKNNHIIISIGYCDLQHLLQYFSPIYYTCGIYGWNCDAYYVKNNILLCTGYRPPAGDLKVNYNLVREYDLKAEKISNDFSQKYQDKKQTLQALFNEFINKILEENYNE